MFEAYFWYFLSKNIGISRISSKNASNEALKFYYHADKVEGKYNWNQNKILIFPLKSCKNFLIYILMEMGRALWWSWEQQLSNHQTFCYNLAWNADFSCFFLSFFSQYQPICRTKFVFSLKSTMSCTEAWRWWPHTKISGSAIISRLPGTLSSAPSPRLLLWKSVYTYRIDLQITVGKDDSSGYGMVLDLPPPLTSSLKPAWLRHIARSHQIGRCQK